jgi:hypothetical protein
LPFDEGDISNGFLCAGDFDFGLAMGQIPCLKCFVDRGPSSGGLLPGFFGIALAPAGAKSEVF